MNEVIAIHGQAKEVLDIASYKNRTIRLDLNRKIYLHLVSKPIDYNIIKGTRKNRDE